MNVCVDSDCDRPTLTEVDRVTTGNLLWWLVQLYWCYVRTYIMQACVRCGVTDLPVNKRQRGDVKVNDDLGPTHSLPVLQCPPSDCRCLLFSVTVDFCAPYKLLQTYYYCMRRMPA